MSQELERVYTVPLGKVLLSQSQHRAVRAINMIREFARKHMKTQEIKIDEEVAHLIWSRGVRSPPRKIRVRMTKTDDGFILVSKYEGESESEEKDTKKSPEIKQEPELQIEDPDAIEVTEETLKEETAEIEKPKADKPKEEKPKAKESKPKADKSQSKLVSGSSQSKVFSSGIIPNGSYLSKRVSPAIALNNTTFVLFDDDMSTSELFSSNIPPSILEIELITPTGILLAP